MSRRTGRRPWTRVAAVVIPIAFAVVVLMDLIWDSDALSLLEILLAPLVLGLACVGVEAIVLRFTRRAEHRAPQPSTSTGGET